MQTSLLRDFGLPQQTFLYFPCILEKAQATFIVNLREVCLFVYYLKTNKPKMPEGHLEARRTPMNIGGGLRFCFSPQQEADFTVLGQSPQALLSFIPKG